MSVTAGSVIAVAKAEVGYHEGRSGGHWNNKEKYAAQVPGLEWADYQAWCATFVSYCATKAGARDLYPITASCFAGVSWFKQADRFSEYPAVGAQVFYGPHGGEHTGLVVSYDADNIYTIEGNTNDNGSAEGDGVYAKTRPRRSDHVYGYGYPKFEEGIKSADPAFADEAPKFVAPKPKPVYAPFPGATFFKIGRKSPIIAAMHKRLVAEGCSKYRSSTGADTWGSGDIASYAAFQRKLGYSGKDANGIPGATSWSKLHVPKS